MSVKKVNKTTGSTTKVAGLVNSEKVNTMYGAFPSDASASNKLVSNATADEKISDESQVIFEVMGKNGAKNLLPNNAISKTINGITYTVNEDGSVTADGTATSNSEFIIIQHNSDIATEFKQNIIGKTLTLSGCPDGGGSSKYHVRKWGQGSSGTYYDQGKGVTFTPTLEEYDSYTWNFQIRIMSGITVSNLLFKPMLRLASDTDDTYEPYAKTNQQLTQDKAEQAEVNDIVNVYGAKNLYTLTMKHLMEDNDGAWNGNIFTSHGISYTCNFDDAGFLESVTINGTANAASALSVRSYGWIDDIIGQSIVGVMETEDGSVGKARWSVAIRDKDEQLLVNSDYLYSDNAQRQATNVVVVPSNSHYIRSQIYIANGATLSNVTVKLMICLKSVYDLDSSWQPSSKTNIELTEDTTALLDNMEVNGAVNMLPNNVTSQVISEVTFTVNSDKSITAVVASTPSSARYFDIYNFDASYPHIGETLKLSGCPKNGGSDTYALLVNNASVGIGASDYGDGKIFLFDNDGTTTPARARIKIGTSCPAGTYLFKPMLSTPSLNLSYDDYVPYAKSNKELTEDVADIVKGGAYVYTLPTYFYHIAITASKGSGQFIKLVTIHGEINLATSSSTIKIPVGQKVLLNQSNDTSAWTYSLDGLTANLDSTGHLVGYIISNHPVTFTVVDTSTPEANTLDILNLSLLSNS